MSLIVSATTAVYGSNPNYLTATLLSPICHTHLLHVLWLGPAVCACPLVRSLQECVCIVEEKGMLHSKEGEALTGMGEI